MAERVVGLTLTDPPGETTHWTGAMMAAATGISVSSVQRIWRAHDLQPHRVQQFKLSNDPKFVDKLRDVVGLYVDPPAHAIVLSVDEKSQIPALDRTQGLPMKKGRAGTMTHDYKRNGTTTLFAALDVLEGTVIGRNMQRHRHVGSRTSARCPRLLDRLAQAADAGFALGLVAGRIAKHQTVAGGRPVIFRQRRSVHTKFVGELHNRPIVTTFVKMGDNLDTGFGRRKGHMVGQLRVEEIVEKLASLRIDAAHALQVAAHMAFIDEVGQRRLEHQRRELPGGAQRMRNALA